MDPGMAGPADPASEGAARFSCPPTFAAMAPASELPRLSLETLLGPDTELWLIRTPADFTPNCLDGRLVPLCGSQIVKGKVAGKRHRYRVLSTSGPQVGEATLLAPSAQADGGLTCAPAPQGSLRIFEGPQKSLPGTPLQPIPASLPPQIPPGLRPRFCAFGGSPPVTGPGSALSPKSPASGKKKKKRQVPEASIPWGSVNGNGAQEVDANMGSLEQPEGVEPLATEPAGEVPEAAGVPSLSTTKKKKKKKLGGTEVSELYMGLPEPDVKPVKSEPGVQAEPQEETALSPTKRKMQKGAEVTESVEGTGGASPLQVKVEPQDEAIPLPSVKKRKKEKRHKEVTDSQGCGAGGEPVPEAVEMEGRCVQEEGPAPELPGDEAALVWTKKKKKKKEKWQQSMLEPGAEALDEAMDPGLPGDMEPQAAPASTKKRKKERGPSVTEPGSEVTSPPGVVEAPASTKKRRDSESGGLHQDALLLNVDPGEGAVGKREKKRKKHLQQDPV